MKTERLFIKTGLAKQLLEKNTSNRFVRRRIVLEYARQMKDGSWLEDTGEPIIIADEGTIIDGQHRLYAIIESGCSYNFLVVEGININVFPVIDTGIKRTPGDALYINGVSNSVNIAKGIRTYYNYKMSRMAINSTAPISNLELIRQYNKRPKYWEGCYDMAAKWYRQSHLLSVGEYIGLFAYLDEIDSSDSYNFLSKFAEGTDLGKGNPIFVLREKFTQVKMSPTLTLTPVIKSAFIFKSWNAYREGRSIAVLRYNPTEERFPVTK
jgi:hypothetical protein